MEEQNYRVESDLLGELKVPANAYYGVRHQQLSHLTQEDA